MNEGVHLLRRSYAIRLNIKRKHLKNIQNPSEASFLTVVKTDNKNLISMNFNPINFQLYIRVGTHLGCKGLKGQLSQPTACRENKCQSTPIICCILLMKTIKNMIFISNDLGKLLFYMSIGIGRYSKYIQYQLA